MTDKIHWLGHATFRLETPAGIVYIDPYQIADNAVPADIILITHDHFDHCSPEDIKKIQNEKTVFVCPPSCRKAISGDVREITRGQTLEINGLVVEAVPAYNVDKDFHPQSSDNVGYILTIDGQRLYHAGDTDVIPEMESIQADVALLPCGGTYTMTADEAARAVQVLKPRLVIPMHWGSIVGGKEDAERLKSLCPDVDVCLLEKES